MTEGALMFPGAGIRVNLPSYVDTSSIKADAPTGYRINIVGHTDRILQIWLHLFIPIK